MGEVMPLNSPRTRSSRTIVASACSTERYRAPVAALWKRTFTAQLAERARVISSRRRRRACVEWIAHDQPRNTYARTLGIRIVARDLHYNVPAMVPATKSTAGVSLVFSFVATASTAASSASVDLAQHWHALQS